MSVRNRNNYYSNSRERKNILIMVWYPDDGNAMISLSITDQALGVRTNALHSTLMQIYGYNSIGT